MNLDQAQGAFDLAFEHYTVCLKKYKEAEVLLHRAQWDLYEIEQRTANWQTMQQEAGARHKRRSLFRVM